MTKPQNHLWQWNDWEVAWNIEKCNMTSTVSTVLIHGFGACKEHWRYNQSAISEYSPCFAIDLIGFGASSQPIARLKGEPNSSGEFEYNFDNWAQQIVDFCNEIVKTPVILVGNSIGGVIALRASQLLDKKCSGVVLVGCATRALDDKRLNNQSILAQFARPWLKSLVSQRWLSINLFRNAASTGVITKVLKQAYPTGRNVDESLIQLLKKPSKRKGAPEAFHGFINLFDDYLAPQLMEDLEIPVDLIWGEKDPWEPLKEAQNWYENIACIRSLKIIAKTGHCPHDEEPEQVNLILKKIIQAAK